MNNTTQLNICEAEIKLKSSLAILDQVTSDLYRVSSYAKEEQTIEGLLLVNYACMVDLQRDHDMALGIESLLRSCFDHVSKARSEILD